MAAPLPFPIGLTPLNVGHADPTSAVALARGAEALGYESVWTFEHVVVPEDYASRYPYHGSGKMPAEPTTPFLDPLVTLAYAAAATKTLRLGTGVNILAQTNPLLFAKQAATLDVLSGGRTLFGVGAGWLREEFDAMGTPFEGRGARLDDALQAIRKVWSGDAFSHQSAYLRWEGFRSYPVPAQRPGPPLLVGGVTEPAIRRVARHGDGWFAVSADLDGFVALRDRLRAVCAEEGRDPDTVPITTSWFPLKEGIESWKRYRDEGAARLVVLLGGFGDEPVPQAIARIAEGVAKG